MAKFPLYMMQDFVSVVSVNGPYKCEETLMITNEVKALINMKMAWKSKTDEKVPCSL